MRKKYIFLLTALILFSALYGQHIKYPFQNPALPLEHRINDLTGRLTLEEKASLMLYNSPAIERLGIPAYNWWNECLHGVARAGKATVFPQAIGMAATFDDSLLYRVACAISDEARAKHYAALRKGNRSQYTGLSFWSPNVNIFRDPRWGRGQETYGEDPYHCGRLGSAFVKGLQGNNPKFLKTSACAKHFAVHSGPEAVRHRFNAAPTETDLWDTYLPAFKTLVDSGVESVMCAYNRLYGKPCCGNKYLLDDILRKKWGFKGHIVSDCWALDDFWARHKVVPTKTEAAVMAAQAGVDLNCGYIYKYLLRAVKQGLLDEQVIDSNLHYVLKTRFKLGLFDPGEKTPWSGLSEKIVDGPEHRTLAYEVASKSVVLLKNDGVLPLKNPEKIFVTGDLATDMTVLTGNYNGYSGNMVTLLEGIVDRADAGTVVDYAKGYLLSEDSVFNGFWQAGMARVTIAAVGINSLLEGENGDAMLNRNGGDRTSIELPENQVNFLNQLKKAISKKKKQKLIIVVFGGAAISLKNIENLADAILFAWYPGEEGGHALADIIFGNVNPSGKLPVTFYQSTSDLPPFNDYSMQGRTYRYFKGKPLYPFGYGLSYTHFKVGGTHFSSSKLTPKDVLTVKVTVSNTGNYDGDEVIQMYAVKGKATAQMPLKTLIDFRRVSVKKGKQATITFRVPVSRLQLWDVKEKKYRVFPGNYLIQIGKNSADIAVSKEIKVTQLSQVN